jgi:hypothetical protein
MLFGDTMRGSSVRAVLGRFVEIVARCYARCVLMGFRSLWRLLG